MDSLFETLRNLGAGRLAVMALTFFGLILFFIFIAMRSNTPGLTLLYSNLSAADSTEIAAKLEVAKVTYRLSDDGTQVSVPQRDVGKARLLLAQEGLPHQGSVGYEIFDQKQSFGTTSFVQNINQIRALEGELSRTVSALSSVKSARVHLVLPQRELFGKDTAPASASVFLNLRGVGSPGQEEIQAIQHLVAASVPRLKAVNVAIVDQNGNLLARGEEDTPDKIASGNGEEMRQTYERRTARGIEDMIGRIVGYGKVRATVAADMNFDVVNRNSETYNPEGQVARSTQTTNEENSEGGSAGGGADNLPGLPGEKAAAPSSSSASKNNRTEETTNYEISKTVESTLRAGGQVQKLSVAVLIDGKYETDTTAQKPADAPKDWQPPKKYIARDKAEMDKITSLVKSAVGYDESRGDALEVVNMQFAEDALPEGGATGPANDNMLAGFQKSDLLGVAQTLTLSLVAILVILLVLKPLATHAIASASTPRSSGGGDDGSAMLASGGAHAQLSAPSPMMGGQPSELEQMIDMSQVEGKVKASSVQKISELVTNHPGETVSVIRSWMSQEG